MSVVNNLTFESFEKKKKNETNTNTFRSSYLGVDAVVHDVAGKMMFPTPEQIPREFSQLSKFTVSGALGGFQLLRLYQETFFLERFFQTLSGQRLLALPFGIFRLKVQRFVESRTGGRGYLEIANSR